MNVYSQNSMEKQLSLEGVMSELIPAMCILVKDLSI